MAHSNLHRPFFADTYGRKTSIIIGCVGEAICAFIDAFSNGYGSCIVVHMAGRFILGFGSSLNGRMAGLLISEVAHPQNRAKASAIVNYIYLGTVSGPPLTPGWRWPPSASLATGHGRSLTLLQAFPVVLVLAFIHWIPESPRWLVAKERYEEAEQMLALYHGNGDWANKTVAFGFREIE
ncbi:putative mfs hexose [Diaporthe ampelina]|uniref:Putative mfs hexose n=1 Tax=Diaporthe ampelina TaxID=1214573 RepID=A0A0G2HTT6_9PEZI|nr:putative mfs hexose [Diaporthe ampelina]